MNDNYTQLKNTLTEIFQLNQAELDFGIYRIMNQKRTEINDFLENRLLKQVREILQQSGGGEAEQLKKDLEDKEKTLRELGVDPDTNSKVQELRAQYQATGSPEAMENEVFSHLANFFRRYYKEGDFISQRRYKDDTYAIPYQGEEVKLYWANHDQYYIKTSEHFKNYRFKVGNGRSVSFELKEAATEQNNNKAQQGKERRFRLHTGERREDSVEVVDNELKIYFTYELADKKEKQDDLMAEAFKKLKTLIPADWQADVLVLKPTEKKKDRTLLEKHMAEYTARNTFDYFIHKNLGDFLNRELDFYIKNEVLHIDDIALDEDRAFKKQLQVIKALKGVAHKIIAFLAQLENFQKKLWLKKKFVVQSDYCITLDRIPEDFYEEIAANEAQREEWVKLFAIDEIKGDLVKPAYSVPLTVDFLKANPFLVLDTQFFGQDFKYRLLAEIDQLDEQTDGLLINSENFQALNLLQERYQEQVKCVYIDPPYNTGEDGFAYKDNFRFSSWLSMMESRFVKAFNQLTNDGIFLCSIDDYELNRLHLLFQQLVGQEFWEATFIRKRRTSSAMSQNLISQDHEYIACYTKFNFNKANGVPKEYSGYSNPNKDPRGDWTFDNLTVGMDRSMRPNQYYDLVSPYTGTTYPANPNRVWAFIPESMNQKIKEDRIAFPDDPRLKELGVSLSGPLYKRFKIDLKSDVNPVSTIIELGKENSTGNGRAVLKSGLNTEATKELQNIFGNNQFSYAKPMTLAKAFVDQFCSEKQIMMDYFAGSGTTAHAVITKNRKDEGKRKYILVEMGEYFNTVTKPRIQKVIYSEDWKDGKPVSRKGSSHCFKYLRLESYEDTLNNLQLRRSSSQQALLGGSEFREDYMLHYMLDVESRDSLLSVSTFEDPFSYTIKTTENNELKDTPVDLVETFNYLIGLVVESIQHIRGFVVVLGHNLEEEKILVIWRNVKEQDNEALNEFFRRQQFNPRDQEFDRIYVNGDNNLENLRTDEDHWKVVLIEEEFHKRMFDVADV